jgi:hypothetical protein
MKQISRIFSLIVLSALCIFVICFISGCENNHIHGTGKQTTEIRFPGSFHSVRISDNIETIFHFHQSPPARIEIEGGEKLLPAVKTSIKDSVLYLSNDNKMNWLRSYRKSNIKINVFTDSIRYLYYNGYENIIFRDTLKSSSFRCETSGGMGNLSLKLVCDSFFLTAQRGAPEFFLSGKVSSFFIYSNSYGIIDALHLSANHTEVHSASTAECFVSPINSLGVTIDYIGNVYYQNNPDILWVAENHLGRLIKIN